MQNALWKLTALAGVVGIGSLVVLQAQRGLSPQTPGIVGQNETGDLTGDPSDGSDKAGDKFPRTADPLADLGNGSGEFGDPEPVPRRRASSGESSVGGTGRASLNAPSRDELSDPFGESVASRSDETPVDADNNAGPSGVEFGQENPRSASSPKPRGLDFRDDPVSSRAASREPTPADDDPFAGDAVTPTSGRASDEPRRVMPATDEQPSEEEGPRPRATAAMNETEPEPAGDGASPGPQLFGPVRTAGADSRNEGDPSFFGDDLPSQPKGTARSDDRKPEKLDDDRATDPRRRDVEPGRDIESSDSDRRVRPLEPTPVDAADSKDAKPADSSATPAAATEDSDRGYLRREPRTPTRATEPEPAREPNLLREMDRDVEPVSPRSTANSDIPFDGSFPARETDEKTLPEPRRTLPRGDDRRESRSDDSPAFDRRDEPSRSEPAPRETLPRDTRSREPDPEPRETVVPMARPRDFDSESPRPRGVPEIDRSEIRPRATDDRGLRDPLERPTSRDRDLDREPLEQSPRERSTPRPESRDDLRDPPADSLRGDGTVNSDAPKGPQKPQLKIEKVAPPNAVLGQPLVYHIHIRNVGDTAAQDVVVEDRIPKGSELAGTIPRAELADKTLVWKLGTMQPGEEKKLSVRVTPLTEGQIGSVATVNFVAEVASKTLITAPKLQLDLIGPKQVRTGEAVPYVFKVRNIGSADAKGVIIRNIVPEGLRHPDGSDLEYELGTLGAGLSREVRLTLTAVKMGESMNRALATADGGVSIEATAPVDVLGPSLAITRTGPKRSYLGRPAQFTTTVVNESNDTISGATIIETVPEGLEFLESDPPGHYHPERKTISWRVDRLRPQQNAVLKVKLRPKSAGVKSSTVRTVEATGTASEVVAETEVIGVANLDTDVSGLTGNLALGDKVVFRVVVRNRGNDAASNVKLRLGIPEELELVEAEAQSRTSADGREVSFPAVTRLDANRETAFNVVLRAVKAGNVRMTLTTDADDLGRPLTKDEQVVILQEGEASAVSSPRR